ncbi:MAG: hypothetical protein Q7S61_04830 [bacterium]|nr:hypothetical protein [bacterium]
MKIQILNLEDDPDGRSTQKLIIEKIFVPKLSQKDEVSIINGGYLTETEKLLSGWIPEAQNISFIVADATLDWAKDSRGDGGNGFLIVSRRLQKIGEDALTNNNLDLLKRLKGITVFTNTSQETNINLNFAPYRELTETCQKLGIILVDNPRKSSFDLVELMSQDIERRTLGRGESPYAHPQTKK